MIKNYLHISKKAIIGNYLYDLIYIKQHLAISSIGQKQIKALEKLYVFYRNPLLAEPRQEDIRHKSLKYWMIPDRPKTAPVKQTLDDVLDSSMQDSGLVKQTETVFSIIL